MGLWNWITGMFGGHDRIADAHSPTHTDINPVTGLPMVGDLGGIDVAGNPFGHDLLRSQDSNPTGPCWHDQSSGSIGGIGPGSTDTWIRGTWSDWDH